MAFNLAILLVVLVAHCADSQPFNGLENTIFNRARKHKELTDLDQNDFDEHDAAPAKRLFHGYWGKVGVSYIRWGKNTCPGNSGTTLVYNGFVGGSWYNNKGGASNYLCLPDKPIYNKYKTGAQTERSGIYGAEYQTGSDGIFPSYLYQHDVPCAVCHVTNRASQIMIPARNVCPAGWRREYHGYLMAAKYTHYRTMYTCVDENPDYRPGSHANVNGALFYFVEGKCGSLPCKPYVNGRELTCAVCTR